jgi:hypothetical protein
MLYELRQPRNRRFDRQFAETELIAISQRLATLACNATGGRRNASLIRSLSRFSTKAIRTLVSRSKRIDQGCAFTRKSSASGSSKSLATELNSIDPMLALEFFDCFQPQLPALAMRDKVQNRFAVPCNDNRLSSLDKASQCGKPVLGVFDGYHF